MSESMNDRDLKERIYEIVARIGKAASSPKRLELLDLLCQGEKTVEGLARQAGITLNLTSAHLKVLRGARLVEARKEGKHVFYRAANADVVSFWVTLRRLAEQQFTEIEHTMRQFFEDRGDMAQVDLRTLLKRVRDREVVVIDVRPEDEYREGHIPGALSIPLAELKRRLSSIPKSKEIVAYCRGPYCVLSREAVEKLRRKGYRATRISDGVAEWAAAGLQITKGAAP